MTLTPGTGKQKKSKKRVEVKERRKQAHHWSPFLCYSFSMNISFILGISSSLKKTAKNDMKLNMFFEAVQKIWKVSKLESYAKSPCASGILGLKMSSCPVPAFHSEAGEPDNGGHQGLLVAVPGGGVISLSILSCSFCTKRSSFTDDGTEKIDIRAPLSW